MAVVFSVAFFGGLPMQAQTFKALHYFQGWPDDGSKPSSGLTPDAHGHLYGTTASGGKFQQGTVYVVTIATGRVTVLHDFGQHDGRAPLGDLVRDPTGNLYGANYKVAFKLDRNRHLTRLFKFNNGKGPGMSGLAADPAGNMYGTDYYKGTGYWEIYSIGRNGDLRQFGVRSLTGLYPRGKLVFHDGYLYGVTSSGLAGFTDGTIYRVNATDMSQEVLHSFNGIDGSSPQAGLVRDAAGNFYGTTAEGGAFNYGTVFKLDPSWNLTTLYSFAGGDDGWWPSTTLVLDAAGNLYGTTHNGGLEDYGTLFKLDPAGVKTTLHNFIPQEGIPVANLYMDAAGVLYGTSFNKAWNDGMIFSFTP